HSSSPRGTVKSLIPDHKPPLAPPPTSRCSLLSPAGRCTAPSSSNPPAAPHHPSPTSSNPLLHQVAPSHLVTKNPGVIVVLGTGQIPAKSRLNLCRKLLSAVAEHCSMPSRFSNDAPASYCLSTSAPTQPCSPPSPRTPCCRRRRFPTIGTNRHWWFLSTSEGQTFTVHIQETRSDKKGDGFRYEVIKNFKPSSSNGGSYRSWSMELINHARPPAILEALSRRSSMGRSIIFWLLAVGCRRR
uniref:Uncharacterized protein n=1 Tax=Aegilops tauschii subsp. strangulata TaxID=200361 RepID=A0A453LER8_AEGTS